MPENATKTRGAPLRNQNGVKTGLSALAGSGRVPTKLKGGTWIRRQVRRLRKEAFGEFVAIHGRDPSIHEHIVLKVLSRAEARAMLHERMLANDWDELTHEQRTASLSAIGGAGDQLIRCSRELGLDKRPEDESPWLQIPSPPDHDDESAPDVSSDVPDSDAATEARR